MHKTDIVIEISSSFRIVSNLLSQEGHAQWKKGNIKYFKAQILDSTSKGTGESVLGKCIPCKGVEGLPFSTTLCPDWPKISVDDQPHLGTKD